MLEIEEMAEKVVNHNLHYKPAAVIYSAYNSSKPLSESVAICYIFALFLPLVAVLIF